MPGVHATRKPRFKSRYNAHSEIEKSDLRNAFIIVSVVCCILWIITPPHFTETSDDAVMASFAEGYDGNYAVHLLYINIVLGVVIKLLNTYLPGIPWYSLLQLGLCYFSMVVLTFLVLNRAESSWKPIAAALLLTPFAYEILCKLQFTKTAGVSVAAGFTLLVWAIHNKKRILIRVAACVLVVLGSLYRILVFEMLLIPFGGLFVYCVWSNRGDGVRVIMRNVLIPLILLVTICMSLRVVHRVAYASNAGWNVTQSINVARAELIDHGFPDYEEYRELYESLGLTYNDYNLFEAAAYGDPELFTVETIHALADAKEPTEISVDSVFACVRKLSTGLIQYGYAPATLLVFFYAVVYGEKEPRHRLLLAYEILAALALQGYFFLSNRYLQNRVDICYALALFSVIHYAIIRYPSTQIGRKHIASLVTAILLFQAPMTVGNVAKYFKDSNSNDPSELFRTLERDDEHCYLYVYNWVKIPNKIYNVFDPTRKNWSTNSVALGTWRYFTPITEGVLRTWGMSNPYRDIVDNEDVYLLTGGGTDGDLVIKHIQEHYNADARSYAVRDLYDGKYIVCKIDSHKLDITDEDARRAEDISHNKNAIVTPLALSKGIDDKLMVSGEIQIAGHNAFEYNVILELLDAHGKKRYTYARVSCPEDTDELFGGGAAPFEATINGNVSEKVNVYAKTADKLYYLGTLEAERDLETLPLLKDK